jgi:hypothetical protein
VWLEADDRQVERENKEEFENYGKIATYFFFAPGWGLGLT